MIKYTVVHFDEHDIRNVDKFSKLPDALMALKAYQSDPENIQRDINSRYQPHLIKSVRKKP